MAFPQTSSYVSGIEKDLHSQICIFHICTYKAIDDLFITCMSECTNRRKQIQTLRSTGFICSCTIFCLRHPHLLFQQIQHQNSSFSTLSLIQDAFRNTNPGSHRVILLFFILFSRKKSCEHLVLTTFLMDQSLFYKIYKTLRRRNFYHRSK